MNVDPREDIRCPSGALNFRVIDGDRLEIKCDHWQCTERGTVVALHRYSLPDCKYLETKKFRNPTRGHGARANRKKVP